MSPENALHHINLRAYFYKRPGLNKSYFAHNIGCPRSAFSEYLSYKRNLAEHHISILAYVMEKDYGYNPNEVYY
jgi:hypothetical protein